MLPFKLLRCIRRANCRVLCCLVVSVCLHQFSIAGAIDPALAARIKRDKTTKFIQVMLEVADPNAVAEASAFVSTLPRKERPGALAKLLKARSKQPHDQIAKTLATYGGREINSLWLSGKLAVTIPIDAVNAIAQIPGVTRVYVDAILQAPMDRLAVYRPSGTMRRDRLLGRERSVEEMREPVTTFKAVEKTMIADHLVAMNLPDVWKQGFRGQGVTIAILDTGLDPSRAGLTQALHKDKSYWFDPYDQRKKPTDTHGHGTNVAGLIVESQLFSRATAIAPDAKIMAARIFNDEGLGRISAVHRSFEWLLDPDGDPSTNDAPDIVNNAWGLGNTVGRCDLEFSQVITLFRAAGIHMVFAAGNNGPTQGTSLSPANNPGAISVGGIGADGASMWTRSSRGPSACASEMPYPTVLALSQSIDVFDKVGLAADEPIRVQGTSFATALVSGMLAVLRSQNPNASLEQLEVLLTNTSQKRIDGVAVAGYPGVALNSDAPMAKTKREAIVEDGPQARDLSFISVERQPVRVQLLDQQHLGDKNVTIDSVSKPAFGGSVKVNADETVTFTPRANFYGRDHFTYLLKDSEGKISRRGVVTVLVKK
jgi:serine protease AprX